MKKFVTAFLIGTMSIASFTVDAGAYAKEHNVVVVQDVGQLTKTSSLMLKSNEAVCKSTCSRSSEESTSITAVQTLEKKTSWYYQSVSGATWSTTVNTQSLSMRNSKTGLSSGTYRLKTVFTVKYKNGKSETVTVYSAERTVK
ncbi:MAG: hypothetical protein IJ784_01275 [Ruminiclostridium sp.]|uniref:hypothetical protein n=1 Tax=Ruminococcus sp. TaxID=41978 RepID=UPI0025DC423C|nr:hypothetical protein [Ruminococcus sp.]MBR1433047.1 hypothetical protein [Ruminococcus sp.]MBR1831047.1 hypothetical protein [Ruminiclostridium sp.]